MIRAVAVTVPARDEENDIGACLRSVRTALERLPHTVTGMVTVVLDRCRDATPDRVEETIGGWPAAVTLTVERAGASGRSRATAGPAHLAAGCGVGAVRDVGVRDALDRLCLPPRSVWLLHTDADTTVPPTWALAHLAHADAGAAGVAGTVELSGGLSARATRRYDQLVRSRTWGGRHHHAYGANLGVRGDAYLALGGFPLEGAGEDTGLWQAMDTAGYPLRYPMGLRVRTSSRTVGRAAGGLADLLHEMDTTPRAYVPPAG